MSGMNNWCVSVRGNEVDFSSKISSDSHAFDRAKSGLVGVGCMGCILGVNLGGYNQGNEVFIASPT